MLQPLGIPFEKGMTVPDNQLPVHARFFKSYLFRCCGCMGEETEVERGEYEGQVGWENSLQ